MKVIRSIRKMSFVSNICRNKKYKIGFVPTMGALHQGHISLIREAKKENDLVVVSIFVNPAQFGQNEDYKRYPRNLNLDSKLCRQEGVDIIFFPQAKYIYPPGYKTYIEVRDLSDILCAKFRPCHFRGVTTVVTKLFNIVSPDIAYFGQKDAQQAIIIKKMVYDLNIPVRIKVMPTVREKDGLAVSSRHIYMKPEERKNAVVLYQALNRARSLINQGERDSKSIIRQIKKLINMKGINKIDYIAIVDLKDLSLVDRIAGKVMIVLAVWVGKTRLIDNVIVK